jgi:hypothetical protein
MIAVAPLQTSTIPASLLQFIDSGSSPEQFTLDEIARAQTLLELRPFQPLQKFSNNLRDEQLKVLASTKSSLMLVLFFVSCLLKLACFQASAPAATAAPP